MQVLSPPHQEQPGAHRRAGRRQDRHRRGPGPGDRRRQRARDAAQQAALHARPRRPGGRQPLPRRLRGAPQEGAQGDPDPRRHHPVHRRAAHPGRCRRGRGGHRRRVSILKPMLARGELQTIGATTLDEYRKHLEKDAALERRFQPIKVEEPTVAHTIEILKGLRDRYEAHHRVTITDQALVAAANLADRYISDRHLPDKAIDLIDEAGSPPAHQAHGDAARLQGAREPDRPGRAAEEGGGRGPALRRGRQAARPARRSCSPRRRPRSARSRTPASTCSTRSTRSPSPRSSPSGRASRSTS